MKNLQQLIEEGGWLPDADIVYGVRGEMYRYSDVGKDLEGRAVVSLFDENMFFLKIGNPLELYPHPYFPDKEILAFEVVEGFPGAKKGQVFNVINIQDWDSGQEYMGISIPYNNWCVEFCLQNPRHLKPLYQLPEKN